MAVSKRSATKKPLTAAEFDQAFERGGGIESLDLQAATVHAPVRRVNLDLPVPMLQQIDREASRIGVPRTSVIKFWLSEKLHEVKTMQAVRT